MTHREYHTLNAEEYKAYTQEWPQWCEGKLVTDDQCEKSQESTA